jgi:HEAT repeat protein
VKDFLAAPSDGGLQIREKAVLALGDAAVPALVDMLRSAKPESETAKRGGRMLLAIGSPRAFVGVVRLVHDRPAYQRVFVENWGSLATNASWDGVAYAVASLNWPGCISLLDKMGATMTERWPPDGMESLWMLIKESRSQDQFALIADMVGRLKVSDVDTLKRLAGMADKPLLSKTGAYALAQLGTAEAVTALAEVAAALGQDGAAGSWPIEDTIGSVTNEAALPALVEVARSQAPAPVRIGALRALARTNPGTEKLRGMAETQGGSDAELVLLAKKVLAADGSLPEEAKTEEKK